MLSTAQAMMTLIGCGLLVIILCWILVLIHQQRERIQQLEGQMKIREKVKEKEGENG